MNDSTALILTRSAGGEKAEAVLVDYLKGPGKSETRLEVMRLLSVTNSPDSLAVIRGIAFNPDSSLELQIAAVQALARRGDGESVPRLLEALKSGPVELQRAAALALGLIVPRSPTSLPTVQPALEAAADGKDRPLQVQAIIAPWRLGGDAAQKAALPRVLAFTPADDAIQLEILEAVSAKVPDREEPLVLLWLESGRRPQRGDLSVAKMGENRLRAAGFLRRETAGGNRQDHRVPQGEVPQLGTPDLHGDSQDRRRRSTTRQAGFGNVEREERPDARLGSVPHQGQQELHRLPQST